MHTIYEPVLLALKQIYFQESTLKTLKIAFERHFGLDSAGEN
jgi:hypothetical protein